MKAVTEETTNASADTQDHEESSPSDELIRTPNTKYRKLLKSSMVEADVLQERTRTSLQTVFSLWNTMSGSSVVALPYALSRAGIIMGPVMVVFVGALSLYTANIVLDLSRGELEFSLMVYKYLGRKAQVCALIASIMLLAGAAAAYFNIMTSALFTVIAGISEWGNGPAMSLDDNSFNTFSTSHVALILATLMLAFSLLKTPSIFMKINSIGALFISLNIGFISIYGLVQFSRFYDSVTFTNQEGKTQIKLYDPDWSVFAAVLSLGFFSHNFVQPIMRSQKHPEHNRRDLSLGYLLVGFCYAVVAVCGYIGWTLKFGSDIEQNCLNSFSNTNVMAFIFRLAILFQLCTVYPLLIYFVRTQFCSFFFGNEFPSVTKVGILNSVVIGMNALVTILIPKQLGTIIGFTAAITGMVVMFLFPCLCQILKDYGLFRQGPVYRSRVESEQEARKLTGIEDNYVGFNSEDIIHEDINEWHSSSKLMTAKIVGNVVVFCVGFALLYMQFLV